MPIADPPSQHRMHVLYSDHHGWLSGWLRRKLGNGFDAADVAQDVFVHLLAKPPPLQFREPRAYLSTVARRLVIEHWRRRELERAWISVLAQLPEPETPSPESRMIILEALVAIDNMLDSLKPRIRIAFLLAQLEGMTCAQIATRIGVSLATAERYIASALRHCYALQFDR